MSEEDRSQVIEYCERIQATLYRMERKLDALLATPPVDVNVNQSYSAPTNPRGSSR